MNAAGRILVIAALTAAAAGQATAADAPPAGMADSVRGGWEADVNGTRHIFILKVRGTAVSGIYCPKDCTDPANLAFIASGTLTADGVRFRILQNHGREQSSTDVVGRIEGDRLELALNPSRRHATIPRQLSLHRDPRKPAMRTVAELFKSRGIASGPLVFSGSSKPYVAPGPNEPLTPAVLEGLWVWSDGPDKQHFIFKRSGDRLLGVACGPCDNPYTFGALDNFAIHGDTLTFDINHEDWGFGIEYGPFENHAAATLSHHELHMLTTEQAGERIIKGDMVLTGPIRTTTR